MATNSKNKLASRKNTKPDCLKQAHPMETADWVDFKQLLGMCAFSICFTPLCSADRQNGIFYDQELQKKRKKRVN